MADYEASAVILEPTDKGGSYVTDFTPSSGSAPSLGGSPPTPVTPTVRTVPQMPRRLP